MPPFSWPFSTPWTGPPVQLGRPQSSGGCPSDGGVEFLEEGGLPLGAFDFGTYEEGRITVEDGDLVFFYTDGLTETKGPDGDEDFGEDRLNSLLPNSGSSDVGDIFEAIHPNLFNFSGRKDADDDITMIGLKIEDSPADSIAGSVHMVVD